MPINKLGGKKHKRGKNSSIDTKKRILVYATEEQLYGKVLKRLGGSRILLSCSDGQERPGIIPGKFRKRVWFNPGDIVLISLDVIGDKTTCSLDLKYDPDQIEILSRKNLLTFSNTNTNAPQEENAGVEIEFHNDYNNDNSEGQNNKKTIKPRKNMDNDKLLKLMEDNKNIDELLDYI